MNEVITSENIEEMLDMYEDDLMWEGGLEQGEKRRVWRKVEMKKEWVSAGMRMEWGWKLLGDEWNYSNAETEWWICEGSTKGWCRVRKDYESLESRKSYRKVSNVWKEAGKI